MVLFAFGFQAPPVNAASLTTNDLKDLATAVAAAHHLSVPAFLGTIEKESRWDIHARGDHGSSYGLCMFHHPEADWGMSVAQADSPYYCLERMASYWEHGGNKKKWSGYTKYLNSL